MEVVPADLSARLTPRQLDVLQGLLQGLTARQIASALYISPETAREHVANIYCALGVTSRAACIAAVYRRRSPRMQR